MDATYRDTATEQVRGNPFISWETKESILDVMKYLSEGTLKEMTRNEKNRFFYQAGTSELEKRIFEKLPQSVKNKMQREVNAAARKGLEVDNSFIRNNFSSTYIRAGHKYVNGKRIY